VKLKVSSKKNVRSALFREDQGSFIMGSIAAMKSHSKKIGILKESAFTNSLLRALR
jgi:basic membrane lipoprotein Med (substrate-binding protein (PBP1-ABC) superfamily)